MSLSEAANRLIPAPADELEVHLQPITAADLPAVAQFLHDELDPAVPVERWASDVVPSWEVEQPNYGFMLRCDGRVVGAHLAIYSERRIDGVRHRFCNLTTWCVAERYRSHALSLLRALLRQKSYHFTDLSPSSDVQVLNARLGFVYLDTTTCAVANLPWPIRRRGIRIYSRRKTIASVLNGEDLARYRDHARAAAVRHVAIVMGGQTCHVVFRRVRRKNIRSFASLVYVSDTDLFRAAAPHFFRHLLLRHGIAATLIEAHVVAGDFPRSVRVSPRAKMFRSDMLRPDQIDFLYSELTCMRW